MNIRINCLKNLLEIGENKFSCRIGRQGFVTFNKGREGDEKTPLGNYHVRFGLYRADRLPGPPPSSIPFLALDKSDGWCDDPQDPAYNRFVRRPYPASHEKLWREDGAYDIVLVMNHNDSPPETNMGSAVFIHIAQPDDRQTLGCVALTPDTMINLIKNISRETSIKIIA